MDPLRPKPYGRMEVNLPSVSPESHAAPMLSCSKCGGVFSSEKMHYEVSVVSSRNEKDKNGILVPVKSSQSYSRLCPGCFEKLKAWLQQK